MATVSPLKRSLAALALVVMALALFATQPRLLPTSVNEGADGKTASCLSNLNQIARAYALYARDFDDKIPRGVDPEDHTHPYIWKENFGSSFYQAALTAPYLHHILRPYVASGEVFHCPADVGWTQSRLGSTTLTNVRPSSFGMFGTSYYCLTKYGFLQNTAADIPSPSQTLLLFDGDLWHTDSGGPRVNGLFADGHTQSLTAQKFLVAISE